MKKLKLSLTVLIAVLSLNTGCSNRSPEQVTADLYRNSFEGNWDEVKKDCTTVLADNKFGAPIDLKISYQVDSDSAEFKANPLCTLETMTVLEIDGLNATVVSSDDPTTKIRLVRMWGKWLVNEIDHANVLGGKVDPDTGM